MAVAGVIPGEVGRGPLSGNGARAEGRAELLRVVRPSPHRVDAACRHAACLRGLRLAARRVRGAAAAQGTGVAAPAGRRRSAPSAPAHRPDDRHDGAGRRARGAARPRSAGAVALQEQGQLRVRTRPPRAVARDGPLPAGLARVVARRGVPRARRRPGTCLAFACGTRCSRPACLARRRTGSAVWCATWSCGWPATAARCWSRSSCTANDMSLRARCGVILDGDGAPDGFHLNINDRPGPSALRQQ